MREQDVAALRFQGLLLSGVGLSSLIFGLDHDRPRHRAVIAVAALIATGAAAAAALRAARARAPDAILDLDLLKIPTFFAGVVGGFLFRIGIGAMPFLLPLLLQVGFGLTPFQSGSLTFAAAAGAMAMKFTASRLIRRFGFRSILVANALSPPPSLPPMGCSRRDAACRSSSWRC